MNTMKRVLGIAAVAVLIAVGVYFIGFWPPQVALKNISENEIPSQFVNGIHDTLAHTNGTDLIWRAHDSAGSLSWAACTAKVQYPGQSTTTYFYIYIDYNGQQTGSGSMFDPSRTFNGSIGNSADSHGGYILVGEGYVLDRRVTAVVGKSQSGATAQGKVVDGFWAVTAPAQSISDQWLEMNAVDAKGHVLYQIKKTQ